MALSNSQLQLMSSLDNGPEDTFEIFERQLPRTADTCASARTVGKRPTVATLRKVGEVSRTGLISQMMLTSSVPLQGVRYHVCAHLAMLLLHFSAPLFACRLSTL